MKSCVVLLVYLQLAQCNANLSEVAQRIGEGFPSGEEGSQAEEQEIFDADDGATLLRLFYHLITDLEYNLNGLKTAFTECCTSEYLRPRDDIFLASCVKIFLFQIHNYVIS
jgi:hypothetical protein